MNDHLFQQVNNLTQSEIALLTFECVAALSSSEAKWRELQEQGKITKLFRNLNGKNNTLRMAMHENLLTAQKTAQSIINHLAKQHVLSFSVISSLHEKVVQLQLENDQKFSSLYKTLEMMYEDSTEKFNQLNSRVHQLEKRVSLLDWRQSLPYMTYNNKHYTELCIEEKIVCIVNDFYHATEGDWQQDDEKYLEYMLLDLNVDNHISHANFYQYLLNNHSLVERLFSGIHFTRPIASNLYEEEPLLLLLNRQPVSIHDRTKTSTFNLAMSLLTQLAMIEQISRPPVGYELLLVSIPHVNERLHIHRTLHLKGGIPLEQCIHMTNNTPSTVTMYPSVEEAKPLKKALEQHKCSVHLMEVF